MTPVLTHTSAADPRSPFDDGSVQRAAMIGPAGTAKLKLVTEGTNGAGVKVIDVPLGTVKSRLSRALTRLRTEMVTTNG